MKIKNLKLKIKNSPGISLIEILVVVTIFAILGIIVARSVILTLQGSKKSENLVKVRENLDYSLSVIERQIRNASSLDCTDPAASTTNLVYHDQYGIRATFSCINLGTINSYIASGSSRLTSNAVSIPYNGCAFTCKDIATSTDQPYVDIALEAQAATLIGDSQTSTVSAKTRIYLRNY